MTIASFLFYNKLQVVGFCSEILHMQNSKYIM